MKSCPFSSSVLASCWHWIITGIKIGWFFTSLTANSSCPVFIWCPLTARGRRKWTPPSCQYVSLDSSGTLNCTVVGLLRCSGGVLYTFQFSSFMNWIFFSWCPSPSYHLKVQTCEGTSMMGIRVLKGDLLYVIRRRGKKDLSILIFCCIGGQFCFS